MAWNGGPRTEHAGAKNGGGFWGRREWAKKASKVARRRIDKQEVKDGGRDH